MTEQQIKTPEQREREKGNKLEYAYLAPDYLAIYPILGSVVRALGKGWNVLILAPDDKQTLFRQLRQNLKTPQQLNILSLSEFENKFLENKTTFDLVLSMYPNTENNKNIRNNKHIFGKSHVMTVDNDPNRNEYDLISGFEERALHSKGVIAITGTKDGGGKGKTTTALGMATESFVQGGKVAVIQWFKEKKSGAMTWEINEHNFPNILLTPDQFSFYPTGAGFVGSPNMDRVEKETEHIQKARDGVALAQKLILSGEYETIVLDEFVDTLQQVMSYLPYPLLNLYEVQKTLEIARNSSERVIVTGRQITPEWENYVKNSIVISEIKHPWSSKRKGAVSGLDF